MSNRWTPPSFTVAWGSSIMSRLMMLKPWAKERMYQGAGERVAADQDLHEGDDDEHGEQHGQPPLLGLEGPRRGGEEQQGDDLEAQDDGITSRALKILRSMGHVA